MTNSNGTASNSKEQQKKKRVVGRPFKPGKSGNANGRPKQEFTVHGLLTEITHERKRVKGKEKTKLEIILQNVVDKALGGDKWATNFVVERLAGRPHQSVQVDGNLNQSVPDLSKLPVSQLQKLHSGFQNQN